MEGLSPHGLRGASLCRSLRDATFNSQELDYHDGRFSQERMPSCNTAAVKEL